MIVYAIKFKDGTYYAGYGKSDAKTLLGAQLYQSEKKAQYIIDKTSDFHYRRNEGYNIVAVELREREHLISGYGLKGNIYIDEFFNWENEVLNG